MWLQKVSHGFLQVLTDTGLHYVKPSFKERLRLLWMFRNFSILPQQVLSPRQQRFLSELCVDDRMFKFWGAKDGERGQVIGTIMSSALPPARPDDRRSTQRYPVSFEVRYGLGRSLSNGQGCDLSAGGLAFLGPKSYPPGTELELRYRLEPQAEWITMRALVRYSIAGRIGVEFLNANKTHSTFNSVLKVRAEQEKQASSSASGS